MSSRDLPVLKPRQLIRALERMGFRLLGAVELDEIASLSCQLNHRRVKLWNIDVS